MVASTTVLIPKPLVPTTNLNRGVWFSNLIGGFFIMPYEFTIIYCFDYSNFSNSELESKAQKTLSNFLGFVRQTFDGLLENGQALNSIYQDCIANSPKGKKVFDNWLASDDFGASRYIAKASIEIYNWFSKLPKRLQRLVRTNVQKWSVTALRQLTKVSHDLVKELVRSGKKTAAQIKKEREKEGGSERVTEKEEGERGRGGERGSGGS